MTSNFSSDPLTVLVRKADEPRCEPTSENLLSFVYELERCKAWILELNVCSVCLQFPDSLLEDSVAVSRLLQQSTGKCIYILGDTSYGSCCIDVVAAEHVPADAMIHFGPACLSNSSMKTLKSNIPVLYVFPKDTCTELEVIVECIKNALVGSKQTLIISSCECSHTLGNLYKLLHQWQEGVIVAQLVTGETGYHANSSSTDVCSLHCSNHSFQGAAHDIFCLGRGFCLAKDKSLKDIDVLYLGKETPFLHSLLASLFAKSKSFTCISPVGQIYIPQLDTVKLARRQLYLAQCVREARTVGLILASPGDPSLLAGAQHARKLLSLRHPPPRVYTLAVGKPNPAKLANFQELDLFVLLACPQHPLLAPGTSQALSKEYYKPLVGLPEVELALNLERTMCGPDFRDLLSGGCDFIPLKQHDETSEADVSLLTGRVLRMDVNSVPSQNSSNAISKRDPLWQMVEIPGAQFLSERAWQGLDATLGNQAPTLVTTGRSGIPSHYISEPTDNST